MYEFMLHSQVTAPRYEQASNILTGVAGMQPVSTFEQRLIYRQLKAQITKKEGQSVQAQRLYFHQLRRYDTASDTYSLLLQEPPDAGVKDVNVRKVFERALSADDLSRFRTGSAWYRFENQYVAVGSRFVHGNVVVRLYRAYTLTGHREEDPLDAKTPTTDGLHLLDKSGVYTVEACIRTADDATQELRDKAKAELLDLAKLLQGAIDLWPISRLALDTTVKNVQS